MRLRGCSNDGDGAENGVGVAATSDRGEGEGVGGGCDLTELTGVGSGGCAGCEGGKTSTGGGSQGDMCVRSRSCTESNDRAVNGVGVTNAGDGSECGGVGDGCSLTTGLGSGGCAGGEGGKTRVGGL